MGVPEGKVAIIATVRNALAGYSGSIRESAVAGLVGAVLITVFELLQVSAPVLTLFWAMVGCVISAFVYAGLIGLAADGPEDLANRVTKNGARILGAFAIIAFFLFIVAFVGMLSGMLTLIYSNPAQQGALRAAGEDQDRVLAVFQAIAQQNIGLVVFLGLIGAAVWLVITSRLYLAVPATHDLKRIQTFETWRWTNGNLIRIIATRVLLLVPLYALIFAISIGASIVLGLSAPGLPATTTEGLVRGSPAQFAVLRVFQMFLMFSIYYALEARLSVLIYKQLKPATVRASAN
ncbi:MAG: hypothetical protein ABUS57_11905 [Pseudomonadota bacterium]